jgi:hypothetical protein
LPKALADSIADRPAGPVVERVDLVVGVPTVHGCFRTLIARSVRSPHTKSAKRNLFPLARDFRAFLANFP